MSRVGGLICRNVWNTIREFDSEFLRTTNPLEERIRSTTNDKRTGPRANIAIYLEMDRLTRRTSPTGEEIRSALRPMKIFFIPEREREKESNAMPLASMGDLPLARFKTLN